MGNYLGELSAFGAVICWVICSIAFEKAGNKIGSMPVNLIRLIFAFIMITFISLFSRGYLLPTDADANTWLWLSLSGIVGFFIGDLCLFRSFLLIGSRISLLIFSLSTPISAIIGFLVFKEIMSTHAIIGMFITLGGIALVILKKDDNKVKFTHPLEGVVLAVIGALGQSFGVAFGKLGMTFSDGSVYNPWASTQIRIIAATICFILLFFATKRWSHIKNAFKFKEAIGVVAVGSLFGPVIGVTLVLVAVANTSMGIASTITALLPVAIILPHVLLYKEKINPREIIGAVVSVIGVLLLFL